MTERHQEQLFKVGIGFSLFLHTLVFGVIIGKPFQGHFSKKSTTYYVDLMNFSGGGGGSGRSLSPTPVSPKPAGKASPGKVVPPPPQSRSMRDLAAPRTRQDQPTTKPEMTYSKPVAKAPKERNKPVEPAKQETIRRPAEKQKRPTVTKSALEEVYDKYIQGEANLPGGNPSAGVGFGIGGGSGGGRGSGMGTGTGNGVGDGPPLLGNFPYAYYIEIIRGRLTANWLTGGGDRKNGQAVVVVRFKIQRNGMVRDLEIEKSSGPESIDISAQRAVRYSSPFPPLPTSFPDPYLSVFTQFIYGGEEKP